MEETKNVMDVSNTQDIITNLEAVNKEQSGDISFEQQLRMMHPEWFGGKIVVREKFTNAYRKARNKHNKVAKRQRKLNRKRK